MATQAGYVSPARVFARSTTGAIWLGAKQRAALKRLCAPAALKVVLGPPSSGKSTILQELPRYLADAVVLPVAGPQDSALGVLAELLTAAELGLWNLSEIEQRNLLTVFLQERSFQGKRIVVCIDNIAGFSDRAWSEIERLRLLSFDKKRIVELAIVGTEADSERAPLADLLRGDATSVIDAVHLLPAPTDQDVARYIDWRLAQFGIPNTFSEDACRLVNCLAQGRFGFVNILCQVVFMEQLREEVDVIDAGTIQRAAAALATLRENGTLSESLKLRHLEEHAAAAAPMAGRLVVSCHGEVVQTVDLNRRILIGRSKDNDLCIPSPYMSRYHAAILPSADGQYHIVDLNSSIGVLVNGKLASRSTLCDGDVIGLGQFSLKVELDTQRAAAHAPPDSVGLDEASIFPLPSYATARARAVKR